VVVEGDSPPAPGEDGAIADAEKDIHRPDEVRLALLCQGHLTHSKDGAGEDLSAGGASESSKRRCR
jgi:hypothetical protein